MCLTKCNEAYVSLAANKVGAMTTVYLFNCCIATGLGTFKVEECSVECAKELVHDPKNTVISSIGHLGTARKLTRVLGIPVEVDRRNDELKVGDVAVVLSMKERIAPGVELDEEALDKIGYNIRTMRKIE